jgi:serine/threonine-protein kinase
MGIVYRALDPAIGRTVAIKTIRLSDLADPSERAKLRERLFREAQSAGVLSHPGIVTIYDVSEQDGIAYIAMEYVDGPTLDQLMATNPPDGQLVLSLLTQTAAALDYAHKRGIVHRDIKPANIIVHDGTHAKITDFGVARIQSQQLTQAGLMVGTPNYMSPEQIQAKAVDGSADQYSLAVIAFEMLSGEKPFSAESIPALAFKIVHEEPASIQLLNSTLGWTVDTVIRKALSKDPRDRYQTCSDFVSALENACRSCKDWRPLVAGTVTSEATLVEARHAAPAAPPAAPVAGPELVAEPEALTEEDDGRVPLPLRIARVLAVIVLIGGLGAALLIIGFQWFSRSPEPVSRQIPEEQERPTFRRPSPMGEAERPNTLPADHDEVPGGQDTAAPATAGSAPPPQEGTSPNPLQRGGLVETRLLTNPPGAFLVVDGVSEYSCQSPCTLSLPSGRHTLAATMPGFRRTLRILNLPQDADNLINLERMTGTVIVASEPPGAAIRVDGESRDEKTPAMLKLPVGPHKIEVIQNGHGEVQEVDVKDAAITNVNVEFTAK